MASVWWSAGTLPRSQRMNAIAGPRSRCPSRYRKSLTISPRVSRYQSRAARNRVVPSTTCPSRWISAGRRAGRWVALARAGSVPKFSGSGARSGSAGQFRDAVDYAYREPARVPQQDGVTALVRGDRPAGAAGQPVQVTWLRGLERGSHETGPRAAADHQARGSRLPAAQHQRLRRPVGHGEAEVGAEPPGAVQVRLLELQPRQPGHLDQGILGPPRVLPGPRPGLAVQRTVRVFPGSLGRRHSGRVQMCRHDRFPHSR